MSAPSKRILVVDDDKHLQFLASRILGDAGYAVEAASDGSSAIEKIAQDRPDLVILDLTLPSIDGQGVLRHLKNLEQPPPVVVLTAHGEHFAGSGEIRRQAAALMAKPFSLRELVETCDRILSQPAR